MSHNNSNEDNPPTIQQLAGVLNSVTAASRELLALNPDQLLVGEIRHIYKSFITCPTTTAIMGSTPAVENTQSNPSNALRKEILEIKETLAALSKAVNSPLPKATAAKQADPSQPQKTHGNPKTSGKISGVSTTPTYASLAAAPARASAMVELEAEQEPKGFPPAEICNIINRGLANSEHNLVRIAAAKWTMKGNLVFTAGLPITQQQLNNALPTISTLLHKVITVKSGDKPLRLKANVRWSKILLNKVPTGTMSLREAYTPDQCHASLTDENPAYKSLIITQCPTWVRDPASYKPSTVSSLTFAFEDPDGSLAASLIKHKHLYCLGSEVTVKKWKQRPPTKKPTGTTLRDAGSATPTPAIILKPQATDTRKTTKAPQATGPQTRSTKPCN